MTQAHLSVIFYSLLPIAMTVGGTLPKYERHKHKQILPFFRQLWSGTSMASPRTTLKSLSQLLECLCRPGLLHALSCQPFLAILVTPLSLQYWSLSLQYWSLLCPRWGLPLAWALSALPLTPLLLGAVLQLAWIRRGVPFTMVPDCYETFLKVTIFFFSI